MIVAVSVIALGTKETSVGGLEAKRVGVLLASARSASPVAPPPDQVRAEAIAPGTSEPSVRAQSAGFEPAVERSARIRHVGLDENGV